MSSWLVLLFLDIIVYYSLNNFWFFGVGFQIYLWWTAFDSWNNVLLSSLWHCKMNCQEMQHLNDFSPKCFHIKYLRNAYNTTLNLIVNFWNKIFKNNNNKNITFVLEIRHYFFVSLLLFYSMIFFLQIACIMVFL